MHQMVTMKSNRFKLSQRWKISRQGYIPILLLVSLGMLSTWVLVQEVSRLEQERVRTAFTAAAQDRVLVIQRELESSLNVVQDIGSFFDASLRVRRGQFREFVQPVLKRDPSIQSLEWVPRVAAAERDAFIAQARMSFSRFDIVGFAGKLSPSMPENEHFPLLFAHPYQRDKTPLGLDFATVPTELPIIQRARDLKSMQVTLGPSALPRFFGASPLSVYLPVFERLDDEADRLDDSEDRGEGSEKTAGRLRGVAIGRFRLAEIVKRALSSLSPSGIDIDIQFAMTDDLSHTPILYTHWSRLRQDSLPFNAEATDLQSFTDNIEIAGKKWTLICTAVSGIYQPGAWSARFVFAGGIAFTLLFAAYLFTLIGRSEEVARLVSQRTLELQHSNQALNRQVSERLKAEKALQSLNATLEQRVALRAAEAERRAGELEQFAYVTSHDLKAPLRAIANLAQWLEEDLAEKLSEETREQLKLMRDRVGRMHGLIEGLLTYSRVGRSEGELEQIDCVALVAEVVDSIAPPAGFRLEIAPDLPSIYTDRLQLGQVFSNLIGNSIKHHHADSGWVRVSGRHVGDYYEFIVADDGPGIPAEYHDKVFMMFQTLQVKDFGSDTGIGLALVKKIVEEHGGSISLKSSLGKGTEIRFGWTAEKEDKTMPQRTGYPSSASPQA